MTEWTQVSDSGTTLTQMAGDQSDSVIRAGASRFSPTLNSPVHNAALLFVDSHCTKSPWLLQMWSDMYWGY